MRMSARGVELIILMTTGKMPGLDVTVTSGADVFIIDVWIQEKANIREDSTCTLISHGNFNN